MISFGEAASDYAARGWAVLPLARRDKVPSTKGGCKSATDDSAQVQAWWSVYPKDNVGIATGTPSRGLVVIDVDVDNDSGEDGMVTLRQWEVDHGELPETVSALTGRGGLHLYYRCNTPISCSVNKELGVDIRADGGYVVAPPSVHPNGRSYVWENAPEDFPVASADDNVYAFIRHVQGERRRRARFSLPRTIGRGERNDTLFRYASSLQEQGFDDVYISLALERANADKCDEPLGAAEVQAILSSVLDRYEKGSPDRAKADAAEPPRKHFRKLDRNGNATGPVLHDVVGDELIEAHRACMIEGAPAIWDGRRYASGWMEVDRATVGLVRDCRIADQREIRHYVALSAPVLRPSPPTMVAFANGVLDLDAGFSPMTADMVITNIVPHDYDPGAYSAVADRFLDSVSCGDAVVRRNLEEVIGVCMYRSNDFGQCPVLIGSGSNGKSTFIHALRNVLGPENVSSLDLGVVGRQFQTGRLLGKLANLGDDISNERLSGDVLAVFKKIVTGEVVYTDVKNGDGFEFRPYCTLVFSCNELPSLGDSSEGMMRRLFPIPFNARYSRGDAGYDPRLWEKLSSAEAARYLVRVGIEGLRRVRAGNGFTPSGVSDAMVEDVRRDNDSVRQWAEDKDIGASWLAGRVISEAYDSYHDWCLGCSLKPFSKTRFTRKVNATFSLRSEPRRVEFSTGMRSVRVFVTSDLTTV